MGTITNRIKTTIRWNLKGHGRKVPERYRLFDLSKLGDLKFDKENATPDFVDGINYILDQLKGGKP